MTFSTRLPSMAADLSAGLFAGVAAALFATATLPGHAAAQEAEGPKVAAWEPAPARTQAFDLTIRNIMQGYEHVGRSPSRVRWSPDSEWIHFRWLPGGNEWHADAEEWRVPALGGQPERVSDEEAEDLAPLLAGGDLSDDGRWKATAVDGDIYMVDRQEMSVRRLTETAARESTVMFMAGDERVLYREGMNLFSMGIDGAMVEQITDIRSGSPPEEEEEAEGQRSFLERQQEELFEYIRRRKEDVEARRAEREEREAGEAEPLYIAQGERLGGMAPTPDGSHVLLSTSRQASGAERTAVPFWITESGYTEEREVRTKVGDVQGGSRAGLLVTGTGEMTWLDAKPDDYEGETRTFTMGWNDAGTHALVVTRSDDDQNAWIYALDAATGELTLLDHWYDEAWVGGPCSFGCQGWIPGTDRAYFVNESTGWAHLYTVNADGTGKEALTSGEWEVLEVDVHRDEGRFFVTTNEDSPFNQHAGWLDFDGGDIEYLTEGDGRFEVTVSPDGERLAVVHDVANRPPELFVAAEAEPMEMDQVTRSPTEEWLGYDWIVPEIVWFEADDGVMVPARVYRPEDVGAERNGAGVVFVHGAGYLHNVHNYWSSYFREYMFNHFLAASGYVVMDIDYRGSAGYGRDWRTAIYRWMGGKDLSDQVDGVSWMIAEEGVDPDRIGIYGGSYGGFITLMALFTAGETFKSGAALRSVTDWAHYNDGYTSNILNDPHEDGEAYERSSPIYFAEDFGPDQHLVMLHGMVDTNVHFSDVVRLSQRLIELGKENWELAVYPVEGHGFTEPTSWTDEYRRIFELFERTLSEPGCTEGGKLCPVPHGETGGM